MRIIRFNIYHTQSIHYNARPTSICCYALRTAGSFSSITVTSSKNRFHTLSTVAAPVTASPYLRSPLPGLLPSGSRYVGLTRFFVLRVDLLSPPPEWQFHKSRDFCLFCSLLVPQCLARGQAHSRSSINICGVKTEYPVYSTCSIQAISLPFPFFSQANQFDKTFPRTYYVPGPVLGPGDTDSE